MSHDDTTFVTGNEPSDETPFRRGHVVLSEEPTKRVRPFVVLSNSTQLHRSEGYIVVPLATSSGKNAIKLAASDWTIGGPSSDIETFALPWSLQSIKHEDIQRGLGAIDTKQVDEIAATIYELISPLDQ